MQHSIARTDEHIWWKENVIRKFMCMQRSNTAIADNYVVEDWKSADTGVSVIPMCMNILFEHHFEYAERKLTLDSFQIYVL